MKEHNDEIFWGNDLSVLFNWDKLAEVIPTKEMNPSRKLNALARLILYGGLITYLYQMDSIVLVITGIGLFITYLLNKNLEEFKESNPSDVDEDDADYDDLECTKITDENPFMNVLPSDYENNPDRKKACSHSNKNVREKVKELYNKKFPRDSKDIFGRNNSFRQFYTMPASTIPNNRDKFQKWVYSLPETCKERGILPKQNVLFNN